MCLSIPSKITHIDTVSDTATVDTMGVSREVSLALLDTQELNIGDYVLIHVGFAMNVMDKEDALKSIELYELMLSSSDEKT